VLASLWGASYMFIKIGLRDLSAEMVVFARTALASLVAYVAPGFAVAYGVALLDEDFTPVTLIGLFLIVGGSWMAAEGRLPAQRCAAA
jgi:drug/metabolite transporter (DMT)-like permease